MGGRRIQATYRESEAGQASLIDTGSLRRGHLGDSFPLLQREVFLRQLSPCFVYHNDQATVEGNNFMHWLYRLFV
jgi:hypothetical protein